MRASPVIERELRAEARQAFTYWLRVLGASAALVVFVVTMTATMARGPGSPPELGRRLFSNLNLTVFIAIWGLVPLLTADCISRERREGTLGLLFLTPLTSRGVVLGKSVVHMLRAGSLLLAVLPVLALSFLLGGISWQETLMALMVNLTSVCLALAAGLLASSRAREWNRAVLGAMLLNALLCLLYASLFGLGFLLQVMPSFSGASYWGQFSLGQWLGSSFSLLTGAGGEWSIIQSNSRTAILQRWLELAAELLVLGALILVLVVLVAARRAREHWQDESRSTAELWWQRILFEPRFLKSLLRSKMRWTLQRNPIGWLQERTTTARLIKYGWLLFLVVAETWLVTNVNWYNWVKAQSTLALLLIVSLSLSAAASFRRERETGALELILVTPLTERQVIWGRLRGLWGQFLPAAGLLLVAELVFLRSGLGLAYQNYFGVSGAYQNWIWVSGTGLGLWSCSPLGLVISFACLPVIGLYFSLAQRTFLSAWLRTLATGLLVPLVGGYALLVAVFLSVGGFDLNGPMRVTPVLSGQWAVLPMLAVQLALGVLAFGRLHRNLARRRFALG